MGCGAASIVFVVIAFVIIFVLAASIGNIFNGSYDSGSNITASTTKREKLESGAVLETDYIEDEVGIVRNETTMTAGLKNFYKETGVQPCVLLTPSIGDDLSDSELDAYARERYDSLFEDEAHFLLILFYDGDYLSSYCFMTGDKARAVIDMEAEDIFEDYLYRYYDSNRSIEGYISQVFNDTADRIMSVTVSPWVYVLIVAGVILLVVIGFVWWRHAKKQKNLEAQQTEDMLNTPLDKFGDKEAEDLGKKYDDDPNNDPKT